MSNNHSLYLTLKESESVLHRFNEPAITYKEGKLSTAAKTRGLKIRTELESGYLEDFIDKCKQPNLKINLTKDQIDLINNMVDSITSEYLVLEKCFLEQHLMRKILHGVVRMYYVNF